MFRLFTVLQVCVQLMGIRNGRARGEGLAGGRMRRGRGSELEDERAQSYSLESAIPHAVLSKSLHVDYYTYITQGMFQLHITK